MIEKETIYPFNKLKAFTILELVVAMSISSLVILFASMMWGRAMESFSLYENDSSESGELMRMKGTLEDDFFEAKSVLFENDDVLCLMNDGKKITYHFSESEIIRKYEEEEWVVELGEVETEKLFRGEQQKEIGGLVEELKVAFHDEEDGDVFAWRVFKSYGFLGLMDKEI